MAFKRIDIKSTIKEERLDKEFDSEYRKIIQEYKVIVKLIETRKERQNIT